jgi:hypothetical protein
MTKIAILAAGGLALLLMEVGFSLALKRYDLPGENAPFFRGPISRVISELFARDSRQDSRSARLLILVTRDMIQEVYFPHA